MTDETDTTNPTAMEVEATEISDAVGGVDSPEKVTEKAAENDEDDGAPGDGTSGNDDGAPGKEVDAGNDAAIEDAAKKPDALDGENNDTTQNEKSGDAPDADIKDTKEGSPTKEGDDTTKPDKKRSIDEAKSDDEGPMPTLPLKRARTAYFIFADTKREEVKKQHPGEGVAGIAKGIGALWSALEPSEKEIYETQAAKERERVARDTKRLKDAGLWPENANADGSVSAGGGGTQNDNELIFPIGRIRKICKLDPDVKGMSKESALLITKAAELFCAKLGKECVTMASMQNRRKLLPDDVVEVCSIKEKFMFLRPDINDLRKEQLDEVAQKEKENGKGKGGAAKTGEVDGVVNTLESYFGKVRN